MYLPANATLTIDGPAYVTIGEIPWPQAQPIPTQVPQSIPTQVPQAYPNAIPQATPYLVPTAVEQHVPYQVPSQPYATPIMSPHLVPQVMNTPYAVPYPVPNVQPMATPNMMPNMVPYIIPPVPPHITDETPRLAINKKDETTIIIDTIVPGKAGGKTETIPLPYHILPNHGYPILVAGSIIPKEPVSQVDKNLDALKGLEDE